MIGPGALIEWVCQYRLTVSGQICTCQDSTANPTSFGRLHETAISTTLTTPCQHGRRVSNKAARIAGSGARCRAFPGQGQWTLVERPGPAPLAPSQPSKASKLFSLLFGSNFKLFCFFATFFYSTFCHQLSPVTLSLLKRTVVCVRI